MKTETEVNKYCEMMSDDGLNWTAENLLHFMRKDAEEVLERHGMDQPPSQSLRAKRLLDDVNEEIRAMSKAGHPLDADFVRLFGDRSILQDFLAVHRTVWILEGKPI